MRSDDGLITCTNLECLSNGGGSGGAIEWEQRFKDQVADNIRATAQNRARLADVLVSLDQANHRIAELEKQVRRLTPAGDQLAKANAALEVASVKHLARVNELKGEIKALKELHARGKRGVIEAIINDLRTAADRLPAPTSEELDSNG